MIINENKFLIRSQKRKNLLIRISLKIYHYQNPNKFEKIIIFHFAIISDQSTIKNRNANYQSSLNLVVNKKNLYQAKIN